MKLVVGLGNPGRRYRSTRHNVGFRVLDRLAARAGVKLRQRRFQGRFASARLEGAEVGLLQPRTWMNRSGTSLVEALDALPLEDPAHNVLVVLDDLDLPLGRLRLRARGGAGGHRGLQDILDELETRDLPRMRVGIGRPPAGIDPVEWVLERFGEVEEEALAPLLERAADAAGCFLAEGISAAMNRFNADPAPGDSP